AVFGAPNEDPADAYDAILCAAVILDTMAAWSAERAERGLVTNTISIGLHFGMVIQGNVGIADRLEFTTLGDTVNVASRLESMTRQLDAGILLSQEALAAAERSAPLPSDLKARCRDLGLQAVVGHTPIHIIAID